MKTRTLVLLIFSVLIVLTLGRSTYGYVRFRSVLADFERLADEDSRAESTLRRCLVMSLDRETGVRGWLATGENLFLEPYYRANELQPRILEELGTLESPHPGGTEFVRHLREQLDGWDRDIARPLIDPDIMARAASERLALSREGKMRMDAIRTTLQTRSEAVAARHAQHLEALTTYRDDMLRDVLVVAALIALAVLISAAATVRFIERPLAALSTHSDAFRAGNLTNIEVRGVDEVRKLSSSMSLMATQLREDRERDRRFTDLVSNLAAGGDIASIADSALRAVAEEQGAMGGVLWIAKTADAELSPVSAIGLDITSLKDSGANPLARDVRKTGKSTYVDQLERNAHILRSALVDAVPRSLFAAPLHAGGSVVGVVELVGHLEAEKLAGLDRILSRVGLALANAIGNEQTRALRDELSRLADDLQAQNEELRSQEEELRAQSEELVTKQGELMERNEQLTLASRTKTDFVSRMSHELRTPLNAVIGFADVLLTGSELSDGDRRKVSDILAAGHQLLALVNDILDLSKIEAGAMTVRAEDFDLFAAAREACSTVQTIATRRRVTVDVELGPGECPCHADPSRARQVLLNLLTNAIKFTPSNGVVSLRAKREAGVVRIEVADTGIGIAPEHATRLFLPFSQLEPSRADGTGLGLSISRRLVELMGGEIGFSSEPGRGSVFYFTLPAANGIAPTVEKNVPKVDRRILLVEDDPSSLRVTASVLTRAGCTVRTAGNAEDALNWLAKEKFDAAVIDLGLPSVSGFELLRKIRSDESLSALPVAVLTARTLNDVDRKELGERAELVAEKGVMTEAGFVDAIATLRRRIAPPPRRSRCVLVIDDNEVNRRVVKAMLNSSGYDLLEAADAESGIALARAHAPAAVLMDIRMPGMNGLEATRVLKADPTTRSSPVIALSAQAMVGDREEALQAGCIAYLSKPVARRELLSTIESAIAKSATSDGASASPS